MTRSVEKIPVMLPHLHDDARGRAIISSEREIFPQEGDSHYLAIDFSGIWQCSSKKPFDPESDLSSPFQYCEHVKGKISSLSLKEDLVFDEHYKREVNRGGYVVVPSLMDYPVETKARLTPEIICAALEDLGIQERRRQRFILDLLVQDNGEGKTVGLPVGAAYFAFATFLAVMQDAAQTSDHVTQVSHDRTTGSTYISTRFSLKDVEQTNFGSGHVVFKVDENNVVTCHQAQMFLKEGTSIAEEFQKRLVGLTEFGKYVKSQRLSASAVRTKLKVPFRSKVKYRQGRRLSKSEDVTVDRRAREESSGSSSLSRFSLATAAPALAAASTAHHPVAVASVASVVAFSSLFSGAKGWVEKCMEEKKRRAERSRSMSATMS